MFRVQRQLARPLGAHFPQIVFVQEVASPLRRQKHAIGVDDAKSILENAIEEILKSSALTAGEAGSEQQDVRPTLQNPPFEVSKPAGAVRNVVEHVQIDEGGVQEIDF